jgi:uncharacterized protein YggU (UPF0235/DUF167 family)
VKDRRYISEAGRIGEAARHPAARFVRVRAEAGARREMVVREGDDVFEIAVKEKAEQGRANVRIRELLAAQLGVAVSDLRLVSGAHRPSKRFLVAVRSEDPRR